uniref:Uncharacterized protein n=1 Tax=Panagrellus redivivus TaxID=6233 RepID=A0A7E4URI3_PANRE
MLRLYALLCLAFGLALLIGTVGATRSDDECVINFDVNEETRDQYTKLMSEFAEKYDVMLTVAQATDDGTVKYYNSYNIYESNPIHSNPNLYTLPDNFNKKIYFTKFPWINGTNGVIHFVGIKDRTFVWRKVQSEKDGNKDWLNEGIRFDWTKSFVEYDGKDLIAIKQDGKAFRMPEKGRIQELGDYKPKCVPRVGEHCMYDPYTGNTVSRDKDIINVYCKYYFAKRNGKFFFGDGTTEVCLKKEAAAHVVDHDLLYVFAEPYNKTLCNITPTPKPPPGSLTPSPISPAPSGPGSGPLNPNVNPPKQSNSALNSNLFISFVLCTIGGIFLKTMVV